MIRFDVADASVLRPLNSSVIAKRCDVFAFGRCSDGFNGHRIQCQFGWDPKSSKVWLIHPAGCCSLFDYGQAWPDLQTAVAESRRYAADHSRLFELQFVPRLVSLPIVAC